MDLILFLFHTQKPLWTSKYIITEDSLSQKSELFLYTMYILFLQVQKYIVHDYYRTQFLYCMACDTNYYVCRSGDMYIYLLIVYMSHSN